MIALDASQWTLMVMAAICAGLSKAGLTGVGLITVIVSATVFGALDSTGIVLPLFIVGDIGAVTLFRQHARRDVLRRTLPLACVGVMAGALIMRRLDNASFRPILGAVILCLTALQLAQRRWPGMYGEVPHSRPVAWLLGSLAGVTTMLANAAGPLVSLYYVALGLPKLQLVGTMAWFFFLINLFKVPFSFGVGAMRGSSLATAAVLAPAVFGGLLGGRWLLRRLSQRAFDWVIILFAAVAALRLMVL